MRLSGSGYSFGYNQASISTRSNRIGLPVANRSLIYSYFKHVQGYSAGENANTVPISKIRILNNIIDNLSKIKRDNSLNIDLPMDGNLSSEALGELIDRYAKELHQTIAAVNTGYSPSENGLIVSLTA